MRMRGTGTTPRHGSERNRPAGRRRLGVLTVLALCLSALVTTGLQGPARATQATGHDVPPWTTGWSWTYGQTSFHYHAADGTDATILETVTYTVAGVETFNGHDAYKLDISGTITGGNGTVPTSQGTATLSNFGGNVSGTRWVRRSDLALLREYQHQHLTGKGSISIISTNIVADIDLTLTPTPSWKTHDFPLNAGDSWQHDVDIAYTGGFTYDAGSLGGSGSSPFDGTLPFQAPANVSSATISAGGNPSLATDRIYAVNSDGSMSDEIWWSPSFRNDAKEILVLPLNGATLTINRLLTSASVSPPATTLSATATPSLTCAGNTVTVTGNLSSGASGVPVTVQLDQSQIDPGHTVNASATTGTNGAYSATLTVPAQSDQLSRNGARASWGVLVTAGGVTGVTTVVVTPKDCSTLAYTGPAGAAQFGSTTVTAALTDLATPANAAGRTVSFTLTGGATVTATTNGAGVATATLPIAGPPRNATITAAFAGASDLEAAQASAPFTVNKATTGTTVTPSSSTVTIGDPVTFTAAVSPAAAGGTVQFLVDGANFGAPVALAGGTATSPSLASGTIGLGNHTVQAVYNGDADYATSSSSVVTFRVRNPLLPTTTTELASPSTAVAGQTVTLSASVTASSGTDPITGSVTFSDGADVLGVVGLDLAGTASLDVSTLAVGNHSIVAAYSGDDVYNASSSSPAGVSVAKADVDLGLVSADDTTVSGEAVEFTATATAAAPGSGVPSGTAQLLVDGTAVGSPVALSGGVAAFPPVTTLGAGDHTVAVSYGGDASFRSAGTAITQHVTPASTTTSVVATPSPSAQDQPVTITASVAAAAPGSGAPTGTVVFTSDGDIIGAANLSASGGSSQASIEVSTLAPGAHSIVATYPGDGDYLGSESTAISQTVVEGAAVVATTTTVTSSRNPSTYGELVSFTATVTAADGSTPTGSVQFSVDGAGFGDPVDLDANGVAVSATLASPDPGDHTVIAAYLPPATYAGSGDILTQTVEDAGVDLALVSSDDHSDYGQAVTFTATVASQQVGTGTPTGYVQFGVDGAPLGDAVEIHDGVATSPSLASLEPGAHTVTALYSGDPHFVPASTSIDQAVARVATVTTLVSSTSTPTYGDPVTLTATVAPAPNSVGAPTGTVTFRDGTTILATVPVSASGSNGTASLTVSTLGGGAHALSATYSGSASFAGSTSPSLGLTVARRATTLVADATLIKLSPLGLPLGQLRVTLSSSLGPVAGVPVTFGVGASTVCISTTNASGVATCNAAGQLLALALNNGYNAAFLGNANYQPSAAHGGLIK